MLDTFKKIPPLKNCRIDIITICNIRFTALIVYGSEDFTIFVKAGAHQLREMYTDLKFQFKEGLPITLFSNIPIPFKKIDGGVYSLY